MARTIDAPDMADPPDQAPGDPPPENNGLFALWPAPQFGPVFVRSSQTAVVHARNNSGLWESITSVKIVGTDAAEVTVTQPSRYQIRPGDSVDMTLTYSPVRAGPLHAYLVVVSSDGNLLWQNAVALSGEGEDGSAKLAIMPTSVDFHEVQAGSSTSADFSVTNSGSGGADINPSISPDGAFSVDTTDCGTLLLPGGRCILHVTFAPKTKAPYAATLALTGTSVTASLAGTGIAPAQLSMSSIGAFAPQFLGDPQQTVTYRVRNNGVDAAGVLTTQLAQIDPAFVVDSDGCNGQPLAGGASCDVVVRFAPAVHGTHHAALSASATPGGLTQLSWDASALNHAALALKSGNGDFGTITGDIGHTFTIVNTGDETVTNLAEKIGMSPSWFYLNGTAPSPLCFTTLSPGETCNFDVWVATSADGLMQDTVTISGTPSAPLVVPLRALFASPSSLRLRWYGVDNPAIDFGSKLSVPTVANVYVQNVGTANTPPLQLTTTGSGFTLDPSDVCNGIVLKPGYMCKVALLFTPTFTGDFTGTLTATNSADGNTATSKLHAGALVPAFEFSISVNGVVSKVTTLEFPATGIGQASTPTQVTLHNKSNQPQSTALQLSGPFAKVQPGCPATLDIDATCLMTFRFTPSSGGDQTGSASFGAAEGTPVLKLHGVAQ